MANATMCLYPRSDHALPHWKCVLRRCAKCPSTNISDQETNYQYSNTSPSISFHIYHLIARCKTNGRILLNGRNCFRKCKHDSVSKQSTKIYTIKEPVMMETTISNFCTSFYTTEIQKGYKSLW